MVSVFFMVKTIVISFATASDSGILKYIGSVPNDKLPVSNLIARGFSNVASVLFGFFKYTLFSSETGSLVDEPVVCPYI